MDEPGSIGLGVGVGLGLCFAVLYSATNAGLAALGEARIRAIAEDESGALGKEARRCVALGRRVRTRLLVGRVLSVCAAAGSAALLGARFQPWGTFVAVSAVGLAYATLSEVFNAVTRRRASSSALKMLRVVRPLEWLVWPIATPAAALGRLTARLIPAAPSEVEVGHRTVEKLIEKSEQQGELGQEQAKLLRSVLEFRATVAREVMVPRTQVVAFEVDTPLEEVLLAIEENGHSRYPVYRQSMDQVEGILYAKDVFGALRQGLEQQTLGDLARTPVFFAPETQKVSVLLQEMQSRRIHLAVVVDEFGGAAGVVTLEDILEEIVGEIEDEHDDDEAPVRQEGPGHFVADATISIYDLEDYLGEPLGGATDGDYDSLGGLLVHLAGRVPAVGTEVTVGDYDLRVLVSDERHVERVEILRRTPAPEEPEEPNAEPPEAPSAQAS